MKKSCFTDNQIIDALKRAKNGLAVSDLSRELGISTATFYNCRSKYGGMDVSMMARMKELEAVNARLCKMYVEEKIKVETVSEAKSKTINTPKDGLGDSAERRNFDACEAFRISQTCYRYVSKRNAENEQIAHWL